MRPAILDDHSWRPDPKKDSRDYIWKGEFKVRLPRIDTYSPGYLRMVGVPVSGDEESDKIMENEIITTYKTINNMVEVFRYGGRIFITSMDDCVKIYHYIDNHLEAWREWLGNVRINTKEAPVDDLLLLDEFSALTFDHARWLMVNNDKLSYLRRDLGNQYQHSIAALQEAIPTMESIRNKQINDASKAAGSGIRIAGTNESTTSPTGVVDEWDAFNMSRTHLANMKNIERFLPTRESYASFFEEFRRDKSFTTIAPPVDDRFMIPSAASASLNNKLGRS